MRLESLYFSFTLMAWDLRLATKSSIYHLIQTRIMQPLHGGRRVVNVGRDKPVRLRNWQQGYLRLWMLYKTAVLLCWMRGYSSRNVEQCVDILGVSLSDMTEIEIEIT